MNKVIFGSLAASALILMSMTFNGTTNDANSNEAIDAEFIQSEVASMKPQYMPASCWIGEIEGSMCVISSQSACAGPTFCNPNS